MILVTGGAGFIGSNFVLNWLSTQNEGLINLDSLSYAADLNNLESISENKEYFFIKGSIEDQNLIEKILEKYNPRAVINFAAETHVDRSIEDPEMFIKTNILGTTKILKLTKKYNYKKVIIPTTPDVTWLNPYKITKQAVERIAQLFNKEYKLNVSCIKLGNIY